MATTPVSRVLDPRRRFSHHGRRSRRRFHSRRSHRRSAPDRPDRRRVRRQGSRSPDSRPRTAQRRPAPRAAEKGRRNRPAGRGVPEEYGGAGLDKVSNRALGESWPAYASFACFHGAHSGIGTLPIVYFGTEEQKKKYLPKIATGECSGLLLPFGAAGRLGRAGVAHARRALARRQELDLNGQKMWITNGGFADVYIVFAKVDGEKFSCFIVERGTPGFSARRGRKKDGHSRQLDRCRCFSRIARCPRKICCTKSAAATSWRSIF
jgi:alkylation response protein AidB-like acyl-CoA dehydrogenase